MLFLSNGFYLTCSERFAISFIAEFSMMSFPFVCHAHECMLQWLYMALVFPGRSFSCAPFSLVWLPHPLSSTSIQVSPSPMTLNCCLILIHRRCHTLLSQSPIWGLLINTSIAFIFIIFYFLNFFIDYDIT